MKKGGRPNRFGAKKRVSAELVRDRKNRDHEAELRTVLRMTLDAALITAADIFGLGEKRAQEYSSRFAEVYNEIAQMIVVDAQSDREIVYTRAKVDERLKEILGSGFVPWEERYCWGQSKPSENIAPLDNLQRQGGI